MSIDVEEARRILNLFEDSARKFFETYIVASIASFGTGVAMVMLTITWVLNHQDLIVKLRDPQLFVARMYSELFSGLALLSAILMIVSLILLYAMYKLFLSYGFSLELFHKMDPEVLKKLSPYIEVQRIDDAMKDLDKYVGRLLNVGVAEVFLGYMAVLLLLFTLASRQGAVMVIGGPLIAVTIVLAFVLAYLIYTLFNRLGMVYAKTSASLVGKLYAISIFMSLLSIPAGMSVNALSFLAGIISLLIFIAVVIALYGLVKDIAFTNKEILSKLTELSSRTLSEEEF